VNRVELTRRKLLLSERLWSGLAAAFFVTICLIYFLACRRLSLVFEWTFLIGFMAALPLSLIARRRAGSPRWQGCWKLLFTVAAFSAYYWSSAGFLYLRVD
jgi:hypothetical protein